MWGSSDISLQGTSGNGCRDFWFHNWGWSWWSSLHWIGGEFYPRCKQWMEDHSVSISLCESAFSIEINSFSYIHMYVCMCVCVYVLYMSFMVSLRAYEDMEFSHLFFHILNILFDPMIHHQSWSCRLLAKRTLGSFLTCLKSFYFVKIWIVFSLKGY